MPPPTRPPNTGAGLPPDPPPYDSLFPSSSSPRMSLEETQRYRDRVVQGFLDRLRGDSPAAAAVPSSPRARPAEPIASVAPSLPMPPVLSPSDRAAAAERIISASRARPAEPTASRAPSVRMPPSLSPSRRHRSPAPAPSLRAMAPSSSPSRRHRSPPPPCPPRTSPPPDLSARQHPGRPPPSPQSVLADWAVTESQGVDAEWRSLRRPLARLARQRRAGLAILGGSDDSETTHNRGSADSAIGRTGRARGELRRRRRRRARGPRADTHGWTDRLLDWMADIRARLDRLLEFVLQHHNPHRGLVAGEAAPRLSPCIYQRPVI